MDNRVSATPVLQEMKLGAYILVEPTVGFMMTLVDGADGSVKVNLTGRHDIIDDLVAANYIALSDEAGPSVGAEIYRVTEDGRVA